MDSFQSYSFSSKIGGSFDAVQSPPPQDSGYASGPNNPFENAFQSHFPMNTQLCASTQPSGLQQCYTTVYGYAPSQTRPARPQLRQQQSMPVLPFRYQHADSYDSLDAHISKLSMDAGINTLTGYCDVDSMLAAAHGNTCTTQTERFQAFASQHTSPTRSPRSMKTYPLTPPPLIREPAFPEVKGSPVFSDDFSGSPTRTNRGRHRGRSTHSDIERRYRHNLVSQFQNLANTVPNIPTQQPARAGQTPRPSKAEVLLAACDYIRQLERELGQLRSAIGCELSPRRKP